MSLGYVIVDVSTDAAAANQLAVGVRTLSDTRHRTLARLYIEDRLGVFRYRCRQANEGIADP